MECNPKPKEMNRTWRRKDLSFSLIGLDEAKLKKGTVISVITHQGRTAWESPSRKMPESVVFSHLMEKPRHSTAKQGIRM